MRIIITQSFRADDIVEEEIGTTLDSERISVRIGNVTTLMSKKQFQNMTSLLMNKVTEMLAGSKEKI